jgi:hypothetical protein
MASAATSTTAPGQTSLGAGGPAPLAPGVYDFTFLLQVDRLAPSVTPLATLSVDAPNLPQVVIKQITPISFTQAGVPTAFTLRFDNWTNQAVTANVDVKKPDAAAAAPALTVERISVAPVATPVLGTVWPGKIVYYTNENAEGNVAVYNGAAQPQALTLKLALESDLDTTRPLATLPLNLAPGERREVPVTWNTGKEEWGFALAATLVDAGGQTLDTQRECFSVSDNLWAVGITQGQRGMTDMYNGPEPNESEPVSTVQESEKKLQQILATPAPKVYWNYGNYQEFYAWAPEDFFGLAPTADYWYSGTGNYTNGKKDLQMAIEWLHRKGMRATTYTNPFVIGFGSEKIVARHPEWFVYDKSGQLSVGSYYEKKLEVGETLSTTPGWPWKLQLAPYAFGCNIDPAKLDVIEQQEQGLVASHKMFGWDGVRFDNGVYTAYGYDWQGNEIVPGNDPAKKNAIEAAAWEYLRAQLLKDLGPTFVTGTNYDYEMRDRTPAAWDAVCRHGGLLMEEIPRSSYDPTSVNNRWVDYVARYHQSGEVIRALGGHHLTIGFDRKFPVDELYLQLLTYADRTHPYANVSSDNLPLGNYARFITRYSALFWDVVHVKMLPDAEQRVTVAGPAPLWWKNYATVRTTPAGGKQYLLGLVNPPLQDRIMTDPTNAVPAPQQNVKVTLTQLPGEQLTHAYLLSADPTMTQTPLPLTRDGNTVSVTVPAVYFWSVVVFE